MRGSPYCGLPFPEVSGIIPAHAGLTLRPATNSRRFRDHPRACGAHFKLVVSVYQPAGSSPRMRGSLTSMIFCFLTLGIIPAHAGLTSSLEGGMVISRDHPRACGAHWWLTAVASASRGSSPRMRGSLQVGCLSLSACGIIPAHAGLTNAKAACHAGSRDHPRACGAHTWSSCTKDVNRGSSPRMRGSLDMLDSIGYEIGIIPAHAGLTIEARLAFNSPRDHPRACGAHSFMFAATSQRLGSSPRMRGSRYEYDEVTQEPGIIPAHAGLTFMVLYISVTDWDHPRACGAHQAAMDASNGTKGSSPRMRGSQRYLKNALPFRGIIPAHAGLTLKNPNNDAILSVSNPIFYSVLRVIL